MIRVGPAGWAYEDWDGIVYPQPRPRGFDPLAYLARYFDTVEINSTFYRPAAAATARKWAKRVEDNDRFRFTAKAWQRWLTGVAFGKYPGSASSGCASPRWSPLWASPTRSPSMR